MEDEIPVHFGTVCGDFSLKFKFLRVREFLSVNFQLFIKIMISATDRRLFKLYHRRTCTTDNLQLLLALEVVKIGGPRTLMDPIYSLLRFY